MIDDVEHHYDVCIDARGRRLLKSEDWPFASLRRHLLAIGDDIPDVDED